ncbi:MAG: TetR/AcrR family transcriptional regulator [Candidatus Nanopelagicales bacterium]
MEGLRARNRNAVMAAITQEANRQLLKVGPSELSVRAVARELGMASSAIYRYVSSRDELLTLLIVDGYDDMADAVEGSVGRGSVAARFRAIGLACRSWALGQPHRFALIYGSPIPGYAAPQDTIGPATRIPVLLVSLLQEAGAAPRSSAYTLRVGRSLRPLLTDFEQWSGQADRKFSPEAMALGLMSWTHVIGAISSELFGHRHNVVGESDADRKAYFTFELDVFAGLLGLS